MRSGLLLAGALGVVFAAPTGPAEAKKVYYEINGQRYSYSTNNVAETEQARERIAAANAAAAAKARAEAELASNPLARVFGSRAQTEAQEAEARVRQLISAQPRERAKARSEVKSGPKPGRALAGSAPPPPARVAARSKPRPAEPKPIAEPSTTSAARADGVRSVSYDYESGIKTIMMKDGSVHEELFDASALAPTAPPRSADSTGALPRAPASGRPGN